MPDERDKSVTPSLKSDVNGVGTVGTYKPLLLLNWLLDGVKGDMSSPSSMLGMDIFLLLKLRKLEEDSMFRSCLVDGEPDIPVAASSY